MDNIAFRRFKNTEAGRLDRKNKTTEPAQPLNFIVEFANTTLFPEGFHSSREGWEILPEDEFLLELAKNPQLLQDFQDAKTRMAQALMSSQQLIDKKNEKAEKDLQREFEEFKRWKESKLAQKKFNKENK
jgi:hypothetical protein